jgi:feruloyl-CoA synthase
MSVNTTSRPLPPPFRPLPSPEPRLEVERRPDGTILLKHPDPLKIDERTLIAMFRHWGRVTPNNTMVAKRKAGGDWTRLTYGEAHRQASGVAQWLLDAGLVQGDAVMILSHNTIEHAVFMLGAMMAGVIVAPISPGYSLQSANFAKLKHVGEIVRPKCVFVQSSRTYAKALGALNVPPHMVVAVDEPEAIGATAHSRLIELLATRHVDEAVDALTQDTIAKVMFTSGSTGWAKGVITTHRMIRGALAQDSVTWPLSPGSAPPARLTWLPWNHASGAGLFHYAIRDGAAYYIDEGKPIAGQFDETIRNLREIRPSFYFDVPAGLACLADAMERDVSLRDAFFANLIFIVYAGASVPRGLQERFYDLSAASIGARVPFISGFGSTEAGPGVTQLNWASDEPGNVGLPFPGVVVKLLPLQGDRWEIRAKSDIVTPGYLNQPELTVQTFDEEGFLRMGDAVRFIDEKRPIAGLRFAGRVAEDFKLTTGTFVAATELHSTILGALAPLARNLVLLGPDRPFLGALIWLELQACRGLIGAAAGKMDDVAVINSAVVREAIVSKLRAHNAVNPASSRRVRRALLLETPPSVDANEITDKGSVNQKVGRELRHQEIELVYADHATERVLVS